MRDRTERLKAMELPTLLELLKAGAHFGHRASKWHPKMEEFIFGTRNDVHIVDLEKTVAKLATACDFVRETVAKGGVVLFVGTKTQAQEIVRQNATDAGMPYVTNRWLGGTLTNFSVIRGRVRHFIDLKTKQASGELQKYTKREQLLFTREIEDLDTKFGGIETLERPPNAVFIIDIRNEKTALAEAKRLKIPVVAVCDTNVNPSDVTYCIPGNDDAVKSIEIFSRTIAEAVKEGKALAAKRAAEAAEKAVAATEGKK